MRKQVSIYITISILVLTITLFCVSCAGEPGGILIVTVKTADAVWGYPEVNEAQGFGKSFAEDNTGKWLYPAVGKGVEEHNNMSDELIGERHIGDQVNYVYLYSDLGNKPTETPVLYKGESSTNNSAIKITGIAEGTYYVVAFYDYASGGNQECKLNRYDRYAFYVESDNALDGTDNSSPYVDHAATISIIDKETVELTLEIRRDWVLGKPPTDEGGAPVAST